MEQGRINQENLTPRRLKPPPENQMPPPPQKCPRCDSSNTKFCYYNNYSLSQPRYFCKACRRYWTHGGTLRNVPVGGGCRKTKRPKPSSSSGGEIARTQAFPSPAAIPPPPTAQNLTGMISGQGLPPVGSTGYSFYPAGGTFLSSLAAMQSLPTAANLGSAAGNGQYSANVAFLQNLSSAPQQFQAQNEIFQLNNNIPARPLGSWTQSFISRGGGGGGGGGGSASSSAASPSFWSRADNQAGSSFNPNHNWPDNHNPGMQ
ncbi:hypothetical protein DH2020_041891 [Rehmannia glutinosa]|uniref:Dof zinc finger protein n=1 Tax=Rehmannia glutinosa TaxID=99300 RepID=A0ABR0UQ40_REHGL